MQRQVLTPVVQLIAAKTEHGESYIHRIKDAIASKLKIEAGSEVDFDVNTDVLSIIFDLNDAATVLPLLDELQSKALITYTQKPFNHQRLQAQVDTINPAICDDPKIADPETIKRFVAVEASKTLDDSKSGGATEEFKQKRQPAQLSKDHLTDHAFMTGLIQNAESLSALSIVDPASHKHQPLILYVLRHFSKYKHIAEILMMECICRGNVSELQSLLSVKVQGHKETVTSTVKLLFSTERKLEEKVSSEHHSYLIKANFEIKHFAGYVRQKRECNPDAKYLGSKEEVVECINHVCGEGSIRSQQLIASLDKLDAYQSIQDLFNFGKCK